MADRMSGTYPVPVSGMITDGVHRLAVRIYFEDTDLSGLVYHANYIRFMERARSDLLQVLEIDQRAAQEAGIGVYAVSDLQIRYRAPARLNDALVVETRCSAIGGASVTMEQRIIRPQADGETVLTEASVRVGFLSPQGRPTRQPAEWLEKFRNSFPLQP